MQEHFCLDAATCLAQLNPFTKKKQKISKTGYRLLPTLLMHFKA